MDFFSGMSIAVVAAVLSTWLTMKRFRTERWWEKKAEAYIDLVEALHEMSMVPAEHFNAGASGRDLPEEYQSNLWRSFERAKRRVWKIADSVDFLISSDVAEAIREMKNSLSEADDSSDFYEHLSIIDKAINNCLKEVKTIGAEELGIKKGSSWDSWIPAKIRAHIEDFKSLKNNLGKESK